MSIRVHLYSRLPTFAGNRNLVEVEGSTVGQCLDNLVKQFPDLKTVLFDAQGKLWPTIFVSINLNSPQSEPLTRTIAKKDELYVILIAAGG
jgi:molybdopterin converting factor small subunit